jgi:hypothetical protein
LVWRSERRALLPIGIGDLLRRFLPSLRCNRKGRDLFPSSSSVRSLDAPRVLHSVVPVRPERRANLLRPRAARSLVAAGKRAGAQPTASRRRPAVGGRPSAVDRTRGPADQAPVRSSMCWSSIHNGIRNQT